MRIRCLQPSAAGAIMSRREGRSAIVRKDRSHPSSEPGMRAFMRVLLASWVGHLSPTPVGC
jgi:hypothetical protein